MDIKKQKQKKLTFITTGNTINEQCINKVSRA